MSNKKYRDNLEEMHSKEVAERVRTVMNNQGLNQKRLAKKARVSEPTISRMLNGGRFPYAPTMNKIAEALKVSTDYLLRGQDDDKANIDPDIVTFFEKVYPRLDGPDKLMLRLFLQTLTGHVEGQKKTEET